MVIKTMTSALPWSMQPLKSRRNVCVVRVGGIGDIRADIVVI